MAGSWYEVHEKYYVAHCEEPVISVDHWTELELQAITDYRWWSLAEIEAASDVTAVFVPRELPGLLPGVIAGEVPEQPFAVDVRPPTRSLS